MKQHIISTRGFTRQQWLENRRGGIGGSDVAAILGMSPWRSPYEVWADKTNQLPISDKGNEFTHWGNVMEPILAREFEKQTNKKVYRQNKTYCHPKYDFLRANIDRDIAGEDGFLEIKTAMEYKSQEWADDEVPAAYLLQVQHYMNVLDRPYCYFATLVGGHHFMTKKVERDQTVIDQTQEILIEWWQKHVIEGAPPEVDGTESTERTLRLLYPDSVANAIELPPDVKPFLDQRSQAKQQIKGYQEIVVLADNRVREAMREAGTATCGRYKITNKQNKKGSRVLRIREESE
ncbi:YqaJ viral recombinase family protein [Loigolactobacillus backii]|uniref:YqaJ viral recombinase family nuclease n=1 Tax=Loigolactobacillus backii TaxID=375175 RepID=UPI0022FDA61F|nr:YqaJ viral recombinase family protein [Loigolactobacillus backii]MDA5386494.1 YqaJ viral recombinase family protein [Loigolactobacillus backii]MDA5389021.1 YqaJ viral recombinase family protein [Loigolactobacillus backii]